MPPPVSDDDRFINADQESTTLSRVHPLSLSFLTNTYHLQVYLFQLQGYSSRFVQILDCLMFGPTQKPQIPYALFLRLNSPGVIPTYFLNSPKKADLE